MKDCLAWPGGGLMCFPQDPTFKKHAFPEQIEVLLQPRWNAHRGDSGSLQQDLEPVQFAPHGRSLKFAGHLEL